MTKFENIKLLKQNLSKEITNKKIEEFLSKLISISSQSGNEKKAMTYIESILKKNNILFEKQQVSKGRYNLIVSKGKSDTPGILFNTHVDTVPIYKEAQLIPVKRKGLIFGRGACDAKGSVTSMLMAFLALASTYEFKNISLTLALMVGEENSGDGVATFVKSYKNYKCAIIGEPTGLKISNSQAGYVEILLESTAENGHAFAPISDQSTILMMKALNNLFEHIDKNGKGFKKGFVRWIEGGSRDTFWYTRPTCKSSILINTNPKESPQALVKQIRKIINNVNKSAIRAKLKLNAEDWDKGIHVNNHFWGVRFLENALKQYDYPLEKVSLPSWTDGSTIFSKHIPTIIFGPGDLMDAHTLHEHVKIKEIRIAALCLALLAVQADQYFSTKK